MMYFFLEYLCISSCEEAPINVSYKTENRWKADAWIIILENKFILVKPDRKKDIYKKKSFPVQ